MSNADYQIPEALVFTNENVSQNGKALYLPTYMVAFLEKQVPVNVVYRVDLSGLQGHVPTNPRFRQVIVIAQMGLCVWLIELGVNYFTFYPADILKEEIAAVIVRELDVAR